MSDKYKLYIWEGFQPDYTDGLAIAVARTEKEAIELVIKEYGNVCTIYVWGELSVHELNKPYANYVCGGA